MRRRVKGERPLRGVAMAATHSGQRKLIKERRQKEKRNKDSKRLDEKKGDKNVFYF